MPFQSLISSPFLSSPVSLPRHDEVFFGFTIAPCDVTYSSALLRLRQEPAAVQNQILTATVKMFLKCPQASGDSAPAMSAAQRRADREDVLGGSRRRWAMEFGGHVH